MRHWGLQIIIKNWSFWPGKARVQRGTYGDSTKSWWPHGSISWRPTLIHNCTEHQVNLNIKYNHDLFAIFHFAPAGPYCYLVCSQMGQTFISWLWPLHEGFVSSISKFWNMIIETMGCCSLLIVFNQPDGVVTPTDLRWLLPGKKSHTTPTRPRPRCCRHRLNSREKWWIQQENIDEMRYGSKHVKT